MMVQNRCPICYGQTALLDVVDFNKNCEEARGKYLPLSGKPVYYSQCQNCAFTLAPEFEHWTDADFLEKIYNADYIGIDPDYVEARPRANADAIAKLFDAQKSSIRHLDYGGGNGRLSELLREKKWDSQTYDPFPSNQKKISELGKFNLITAFEVFEHVPDVNQLMDNLKQLMDSSCLLLFSTLTTDGHIKPNSRINWWYASPRNGHISLFSKRSLVLLGGKNKLNFGSFSDGFHCYVNTIPDWARHLVH